MSAAHGSAPPRFPQNFQTDNRFFLEAFKLFLADSGYAPEFPFSDLTTPEQSVVIRMAVMLKKKAAQP